MIDRIQGQVVDCDLTGVVVLTGGLGLRVECSPQTASSFELGEQVTLLTQLLFVGSQEPQPRLFGFRSGEARALFGLLRGVSGIGPSVALRLVGSQPTPGAVAAAIARGDAKSIKVKGVGPKLTKRVISELRDKVGGVVGTGAPVLTTSGRQVRPSASAADPVLEDAYLALRGLEFDAARARQMLDDLRPELSDAPAEVLVRAVLQRS